ncbi:PG1828 family lipoprotein [Fibrella aquatica]|jgi:protein involved in sex pheromone biosynthesis|uniref:PG1828 family lipoprotein n=1 Tax=Fibrella aquatica TaxID=3242487 RepID=UPI0035214E01
MKKVIALLFVGSVLTLAACESKPKTEEAAVDSTAAVIDSAAAVVDSAAATVDSAAAVVDSAASAQ